MKKTICELFAGIGGFRVGLERASKEWETVWFSQWEPSKRKQFAHECYVSHFGDDKNTGIDIQKVDKKLIPDHTLLTGGFPCQDYSVARTGAKGMEGKKGVLWWQIYETLKEKKTPFVLLENVDRILKSPASQRGRDFGVILACFASLGYSAEWRIINAADYGQGQRRKRIFIFAYRNDTVYGKNAIHMDPIAVLGTDGLFAKAFPVQEIESVAECKIVYEDIPDVSDSFHFSFGTAGYMVDGKVYTTDIVPVYENPRPLRDFLEKDVPEKYYIHGTESKWEYLKGAKKVKRVAKTGFEYTFCEGAIAYPDCLDKPARTMLTSEASLNRCSHVIEDPETKRLRLLTPVEAERLQGFDDGWTDTGMTERSRYFCLGNSLVVPLITRMGLELNKIIEAED